MFPILSILLFVALGLVHTQNDPNKRVHFDSSGENFVSKEVPIACSGSTCVKRSVPGSQEELIATGPFWANRGKKDPRYFDERLLVEEPHWFLVRKDKDMSPFFTSRGKKTNIYVGVPKGYVNEEIADPAFFAARGKKMQQQK